MSQSVTANIRMYRLNELGDCFLVTFTSGTSKTRMLVDCGSFRNGDPSIARLETIVAGIKSELNGATLDVVVGTHQHNDHVSGFVHCEDQFRSIGVEQVWLSWLDDPNDAQARQIGKDFNNLTLQLVAAGMMATKFLQAAQKRSDRASTEDEHYPFNEQYKRSSPAKGSRALKVLAARYAKRSDAWRTIDDDWMQQGGALALYLDTFTNNSSLVLAFELVESGKVLLFVADAQTGNWISWKKVQWQHNGVTTDDLLARTVFYKVGHHASHNATLVELFEKVNDPDLVALIPVHKKDGNITKKNGWKMPATNLFTRLVQKTDHRVLQMDDVNPAECNPTRTRPRPPGSARA